MISSRISSVLVFLLIGSIKCDYKITEKFYGGFNGEISIAITEDLSTWKAQLDFDNKVNLTVESGTVESSDELVFTISGSKAVTIGSTLTINFTTNYGDNAGANLIKITFQGKNVELGAENTPKTQTQTVLTIGTKGNYDYGKVLHASLLFYEAQRSGKLPADNRIYWRGDSMLNDKGEDGEDLTGGYYDAGDLVKFGLPGAYAITVIAWGAIDYENAYTKAGELENVRKAIKWGTDFFIKAHVNDSELYGQVGNGAEDHAVWGRPEDWPTTNKRPAYKITAAKPGSELAGETAAAMAAASIVFKKSDATYSAMLLTHAKSLYNFANNSRGNYSESITDAAIYYKSWSGFGDELGWSAAWLYRATNDSTYKTAVEKHWKEFKLNERSNLFSWDDKRAGVQVLMAKLTGESQYKTAVQEYVNWLVHTAPKTPKGLVYLEQWGPFQHSSSAALIALQAADAGINVAECRQFATSQIGYILGDTGRSYVVGVGVNPPVKYHHRAASCADRPAGCDWWAYHSPAPNPHMLTGAMVGGPDIHDGYNDTRDDYVHTEVALCYNCGFQSAVAGLAHLD